MLTYMANSCFTEYVFFGTKENTQRLLDDIRNVVSIDRSKENIPCTWLGYIKANLLPEVKEELSSRGNLSNIEENITETGNGMAEVRLSTETAWCPCAELMDKVAEKYDLQVYYYAEEPGVGIFETNDSDGLFFPFRYVVDSMEAGVGYYDSFQEAVDVIEDMTGIRLDNISEAKEKLSEFNKENTFLLINEITVV